ncbi:peptidylprolyl isomerase [Aliiroseovarius sp.]|uniref:peptidylprolyl isomerase n=1 Tax=Aliiroseovarius sp. TaxID=1872442 RepID=UPI002630AA1F|nr:peptidylprolyl isomerase [Aliiroseovarius sp.]
MAAKRVSRTLGWILMGLVMVGLVGFGATNFGTSAGTIGKVGKTEIDANRYFRELNAEFRAVEAETGQRLTMEQARLFGLDQQVLGRIIATVALENETARLGFSVGDKAVRDQVVQIDAFKGANGSFDRQAYEFALQQSGLTAAEFEGELRVDTALSIVRMAVQRGVVPQSAYIDALYAHARETRSFTWTPLELDKLETEPGAPTDDQLTAWYEANPEPFTLPETKQLTYVWMNPEEVIPTIEVDETVLRALYDERIDEYQVPERRLVERLVFGTAEDAQAAVDRLASGEIDFPALVAERGLALADTDMGDVTLDDLDDAGEAVFALTEPGSIAGPADSDLGPALFRMNAVLAAQNTSFEDAREELQGEYAADTARRQIVAMVQELDEILAGGATLEELEADFDLTLGTLAWTQGSAEGIAAYDSFREAAGAVTTSDFPQITLMSDGGIFALRADRIDAPRVQSLDEARQVAVDGWTDGEKQRLLTLQAEALLADFDGGASPNSKGLTEVVETGLARTDVVSEAPPELLDAVFEMDQGAWRVVPGFDGVILVRVDAITAADLDSDDARLVKQGFNERLSQELGTDLEIAFANALQREAGITLDRAVIDAVNAQFP